MSEFEINIKHNATTTIKVKVGPNSLVSELKEKLSIETKIPASEIKLIYKGKILKNDSDKMSDLSISSESGLHMIHTKPKEPESTTNTPPQTNITGIPNINGTPNMGGLGGFPNMGSMGGMNPQDLLNNPAIAQMAQNLLSDPQALQNLINNNPMLSQMASNNPQLRTMLDNPDLLRQGLGAFSNAAPTQGTNTQPTPNPNAFLNNPNLMQGLGSFQNPQQPTSNPNQPANYEELYKNQLESLTSMGFGNKELNIEILKECYGNVEAAIEKLLSLTR